MLTGTTSWNINGIQLVAGTNVISVTAYDAAGNLASATLAVNVIGGTTNVIFAESGSGSSIDPTKWTTSGSIVTESGGTMQVLTTVTDGGGLLTSVPIPINSTGDITITRNVLTHYANNNYVGDICMEFGNTPWAAVFYANATYSGTGDEPRYGTFIGRNTDVPAGAHFNCIEIGHNADTTAAFPVLWDTWFSEKTIYSPTTGYLQYFVNGQQFTNYFIGIMPATNNPTLQLGFRAWGWFTGHQQIFSNLVVSQVTVLPLTPQLIVIGLVSNRGFQMIFNGTPGSNYTFQSSADLKTWTSVRVFICTNSPTLMTDPEANYSDTKFYRVVSGASW